MGTWEVSAAGAVRWIPALLVKDGLTPDLFAASRAASHVIGLPKATGEATALEFLRAGAGATVAAVLGAG